ncbi:MAG: PASTA domain-containing protein [Ruminococcaceae bacterium]|nr:PASTA domain-containing protein [Oscillospiraceae bacterium]
MKKIKIKILPVVFVLAVASVIAAAVMIYNMLEESNNPLLTSKPDIVLPNFVGITEEQAKSDKNFSFEVEYVYNDEYEENVIISQKPKAPRSVKQNSTVKLKVSKGTMVSEMPAVLMESRGLAEQKLNEIGVHIYFQKEENSEMPAGLVIRTEPEAGTLVTSGEMVTVYISTPEKIKNGVVPDIMGKDISEARRMIVKSRFKMNIINVESPEQPGTVVWYAHGAGAQLPIGTQIDIHVSAGPDYDD